MAFSLNKRSLRSLEGVHPALCLVARRAAEIWPEDGTSFIITEGLRTASRQMDLVRAGASRTMNSRHLSGRDGYAKAIDLAFVVKGDVRWDWPLYKKMADIVKRAADIEKVPIEWGGDWKSFKDGPHFQLPASKYP